MTNGIFCFGELLLRMSPSLGGQWLRRAEMPVYIGGAELNVATALAKWQLPARYGSALPCNYLADEILGELRERNIDLSAIHRSGERIGTYYLPPGSDLKHAGVIYDRAYSSFASLQPGMIDWEKALEGCSWFHFSAIDPALSENAALVCKEALQAATQRGMTISVDLNYRAKLWKYGKHPSAIMPALVEHCQVVMGNLWSVEMLLGIPSPVAESKGRSQKELIAAAVHSMEALQAHYPRVTSVAYTFRLEEEYWAVLQQGTERWLSGKHTIADVVDRIGSGDCFMAGLIYGLYHRHASQQVIGFAAAAASGKLREKGDATNQTIEEIQGLIQPHQQAG